MYICVPAVKKTSSWWFCDKGLSRCMFEILQNFLHEVSRRMVSLRSCLRSVLVHIYQYHVTPFSNFPFLPQFFFMPVPPLTTSLTKFLLASVGLCMQSRKKNTEDLHKVLQVLPRASSNGKAASSGISPYLLKTFIIFTENCLTDTLMPD